MSNVRSTAWFSTLTEQQKEVVRVLSYTADHTAMTLTFENPLPDDLPDELSQEQIDQINAPPEGTPMVAHSIQEQIEDAEEAQAE